MPLAPGALIHRYSDAIAKLPRRPLTAADLLTVAFRVASEGNLEVFYTPSDGITAAARIAIVGITPGEHQMRLGMEAARDALLGGSDPELALLVAKTTAAFAGAMRINLIEMLDGLDLPRHLGIRTSAELFAARSELLHSTSAIRYATFAAGKNYGGSNPAMLQSQLLRGFLFDRLAPELAMVRSAIIVPLGQAVGLALEGLVAAGQLDANRVLIGFPHPSGLNGWRVRQYTTRRGAMADRLATWFG